MRNFAEGLISLSLYDKLDNNITIDPYQNLEIFADIKYINRNVEKRPTHKFLVDNIMTTDPVIIADKFNRLFINIGNILADKIIPEAVRFHSYLNHPTNCVLFCFNLLPKSKCLKSLVA